MKPPTSSSRSDSVRREADRDTDMTDRRRWPRHKVAWSVGLLVAEGTTIVTKTVDASLYGLRLALSPEVAADILRPGETYRFEVHLPGSQARFVRLGEVREIGEHGVGLKMLEALPEVVIGPPSAGRRANEVRVPQAVASAQPRAQGLRSLLAHLRAFPAFRSS
jgi:hypothetical protein